MDYEYKTFYSINSEIKNKQSGESQGKEFHLELREMSSNSKIKEAGFIDNNSNVFESNSIQNGEQKIR